MINPIYFFVDSFLEGTLSFLAGNPFILIGANSAALLVKASLLCTLFPKRLDYPREQKTIVALMLVLLGSISVDTTWIVYLLKTFYFPAISSKICLFFTRISWALTIIQYQALALFIECLSTRIYKIGLRHKISLLISGSSSLFFFAIAFLQFNSVETGTNHYGIKLLLVQCSYICMPLIFAISLHKTMNRLRHTDTPKILKKQLKIFVFGIICPFIALETFQSFINNPETITNQTIISISAVLIAYAFYFCTRKVMSLRFLNFRKHVEEPRRYTFIDSFRGTLEQISRAANTQELVHITKLFFKENVGIPMGRTTLYIRTISALQEQSDNAGESINNSELEETKTHRATAEHFINDRTRQELDTLKIYIYDELEFSNFYEERAEQKHALAFMKELNADVFLPIYHQKTIIAYIVIERDEHSSQLLSNIKRDEMVVFASYLGNVINLLQTKNLNALMQREKELVEELHNKHQEINQYKESLRVFMKQAQQRTIGILFFKNRRFIFGNEAARALIPFNPNQQEGHPLSRHLREIAQRVEQYKAPQTRLYCDAEHNKLVLSALANLEYNNVIITVHHAEIADVIREKIDRLKDPSSWDYLLYLETTKSGQLINQLIPGSGETLLNFKINLLQMALSKKALLLDMSADDLLPTAEIIHHVSLRDQFYLFNTRDYPRDSSMAIQLFGLNPLLEKTTPEVGLLQKLSNNGTLFIKDVHILDLETQEYLAEYIRYGFYRVFKSDLRRQSNARIICSSSRDLQALVEKGGFSQALYTELGKMRLHMPSLITIPAPELHDLAQGFSQQAVKTETLKPLLELSDTEKQRVVNKKPISLVEFKKKVQYLIVEKSKRHDIPDAVAIDEGYSLSEQRLAQAARMGKHALRDPQLMTFLWEKFQNQNKIATFLGVNRSSVNRRCKEYNII